MKAMKLAAIAALVCVSMGVSAKTLTVGMDLSASNPLVKDPAFSKEAASYVAEHIKAMKTKDKLVIKSFGARENAANLKKIELTIKRHRQAKIAKKAAAYIQSMTTDKDNAQQSTNIVAFMEFNDFGCSEGGTVIVITDGIEASQSVNPNDLIAGKKGLPAPDEDAALAGCHVVFYGLGAGWPTKQVKLIRSAWQAYFKKAGASFEAIIP